MMHYFNDSQENGILYLNYPMIEVFKKYSDLITDTDYQNGVIDMSVNPEEWDLDLQLKVGRIGTDRYKEYINRITSQNDWTKYTRDMCNQVLVQNLKKYNKVLNGQYQLPQNCDDLDMEQVLKKQNNLITNEYKFYELCTCIFYMLELRNKNISIDAFLGIT